MRKYQFFSILWIALFVVGYADAARISDVSNTVHNLSMGTSDADRNVSAVSEQRICVFCHTPHHSNAVPQAPLWNRKLAGDDGYAVTYTMYDTSSMDSNRLDGVPTAPSNSSLVKGLSIIRLAPISFATER